MVIHVQNLYKNCRFFIFIDEISNLLLEHLEDLGCHAAVSGKPSYFFIDIQLCSYKMHYI